MSYTLPTDAPAITLPKGEYYFVDVSTDKIPNNSDTGYLRHTANPYPGLTVEADGRVYKAQRRQITGARFSPFTSHDVVIPAKYLAGSRTAAIRELQLRPKERSIIGVDRLSEKSVYRVAVKQDMYLLNLTSRILRDGEFGALTEQQLIQSGKLKYRFTRLFMADCYNTYPQIQGAVWYSRQHKAHQCMILFGDRFDCEQLLEVVEERKITDPVIAGLMVEEIAELRLETTEEAKQFLNTILQTTSP